MGRRLFVLAICVSTAALAACEQVKSSNPLSPDIAGPIAGVNISVPQLMTPAQGAQIALGQPVSVVVQNATTNGVRPLSYEFDLAADAAFQTILFTKSGITPGGNGQTTFTVTVNLTPATYYWRVHAQDGANTGAYATSNFTVYIPVIIQAPVPASPANGSNVTSTSPTLVVTDSARSGPAGPISYVFQVATDPNVTNIVAAGQVAETSAQTSYALSGLSNSTTFYWRVQAMDPSHVSPYSVTTSFATPAAAAPPPSSSQGPMQVNGVWFDHSWTGNVENALRNLLATGLAGSDGLNGQAVVDQMNAMGGIYAGAEFQQAHDGPGGPPVYGFSWFYVAYVPLSNGQLGYQMVEFGTPPPGDGPVPAPVELGASNAWGRNGPAAASTDTRTSPAWSTDDRADGCLPA